MGGAKLFEKKLKTIKFAFGCLSHKTGTVLILYCGNVAFPQFLFALKGKAKGRHKLLII